MMRPIKNSRSLIALTFASITSCIAAAQDSLTSDESKAAALGRQCAVIWYASESKIYKEAELEKDISVAPRLAKALGVSYDEQQFRNAFKKTERKKIVEDFHTLFPLTLETNKNAKVRDMYLVSFWCHAARLFVTLVPLWREQAQQDEARKWVAKPLAEAVKVVRLYHAASTASLYDLGLRSLSDPIHQPAAADKLASDTWKVQKDFLQNFMTQDDAAFAAEPLLLRKP